MFDTAKLTKSVEVTISYVEFSERYLNDHRLTLRTGIAPSSHPVVVHLRWDSDEVN